MKSFPHRTYAAFLCALASACSQGSTSVGASGGSSNLTTTGGASQALGGSSAIGGSSAHATSKPGDEGGTSTTGGASSSVGGRTSNTTGGAVTTGGTKATGGTRAAGGSALGGSIANTGGTAAGGTHNNNTLGGTKATTGGAATGGTPATGGMSTTGGSRATGGSSATSRSCTFPSDWAPSSPTYTYYDLPNSSTACGYNGSNNTISNIANGQYFAAIPGQSSSNFDTSNRCGACVKIGNAIITIVDECPYDGGQNVPCKNNPKGHLDLSRAATSAAGVQGDPNLRNQAAWNFVPCPVTGNVKVRLKPGNNNEFFIENVILPIQSVQCGGQNGSRTSYGAWHFGANVNGQSCSATDIGNSSITFTVGNTQGQDVDSGVQFQKCN